MKTRLLDSLDQDYIVNEIVKDLPKGTKLAEPSIIKVIGVGGGGSNAVNYMFEKIRDVEFAVCNTDRQALANSPVPVKVQLGATLTQGLGAGTDATKGKEAALETIEELKALLGGSTQMVFITAGMGGGTGTGAAPVIAQLAKEMGKLTVAVVTAPYTWEGLDKKEQALEGIEQLKEFSDTVLVVLNDKLEELYEDMTLTQAFAEADGILLNAVKSISEIITTNGNINTDFKDVEKVLKGAGQSVMGTAEATGTDRAQLAIQEALDSPLLNDRDIKGAKRILVTLATSKKKEATMREQTKIWQFVLSQVGGEARMFKLGTISDDSLGDKLRVTVVAAGFDSVESPIPGMKLKGIDKSKTVQPVEVEDKAEIFEEPKEEIVTAVEPVLSPVEEEYEVPPVVAVTHDFEMASTPTGSVDLREELEIVDIYPSHQISIINADDDSNWSNQESAKMEELISSFKNGEIKFSDLEGPAYRRRGIELWKKPTAASGQMEQHWLK